MACSTGSGGRPTCGRWGPPPTHGGRGAPLAAGRRASVVASGSKPKNKMDKPNIKNNTKRGKGEVGEKRKGSPSSSDGGAISSPGDRSRSRTPTGTRGDGAASAAARLSKRQRRMKKQKEKMDRERAVEERKAKEKEEEEKKKEEERVRKQVKGKEGEDQQGSDEMEWNEVSRKRKGGKEEIVGKEKKRGVVGEDRVKGGLKEVYVVCEDVSGQLRRIKKEREEVVLVATEDDGGRGEEAEREEEDHIGVVGRLADRTRKITRDLHGLLLNDANKVTKWMADRVLQQTARYEDVVQQLLLENARLIGRLQERERAQEGMSGVRKGLNEVRARTERVDVNVERMGRMIESVTVRNECAGGSRGPAATAAPVRSYAVVVRGAKESLPAAEVKKRMAEGVMGGVDVRVNHVRPVRGGGLVIEAASDRDRGILTRCPNFKEVGLKVEEPRRLDPRIIIYDVPQPMTDAELLDGLCVKGLNGVMEKEECLKRVKVVRRMRGNGRVGSVIVELPIVCKNKIVMDGRVYVGWMSFKVREYERVLRCYGCMRYGHSVRECKEARVCRRCSKPGHLAAACRAPADCANCRARKQPSGHPADSPECPEYVWRLKLLRSRCNG